MKAAVYLRRPDSAVEKALAQANILSLFMGGRLVRDCVLVAALDTPSVGFEYGGCPA